MTRTAPWPGISRSLVRPAVVLGTLATLATQAEPQATPTFPSAVELVRIDVVVLDKEGKPVTGLTAADFEVTESGKPHEIASFEPIVVRSPASPATDRKLPVPPPVSSSVVPLPEESRYFLIFFDDVHVTAPFAQRVRAQLIPFLEHETREGDWITIVSPLANLHFTARTAFERHQLAPIIRGLKGQFVRNPFKDPLGYYEAMRTSEYGGRAESAVPGRNSTFQASRALMAEELYALAKRRVRRTLSGLSEAIASLSGFRGRKSLIVYSEGFIKSPSMPDYDEVVELAHRARVNVYFVDPRGLGTGEPTFDGADDGGPTLATLQTEGAGLEYLATATGGHVAMSNDLATSFREAVVQAGAYYLIGFQPSAGPNGERKLKVRVRRDGLKVRAPDRYFFGEPARSAKPVLPAVEAVNRVADSTDIPLRVATRFLGVAPNREATTTVAIELLPVAGENSERQLNCLVEARPVGKGDLVRDQFDAILPPGEKAAMATRELKLHPGTWQARVVVRDPRTERLGSVLHTFEVPDTSGFWVSSPSLSSRLERGPNPRPAIQLDQLYRTNDVLYCQYQAHGAATDPTTHRARVTGSYAIVRDGQTVQEGPATPIEPTADGQIQRLIGFGLAGFLPGSYTLVLQVADEVAGKDLELREPFAILAEEN